MIVLRLFSQPEKIKSWSYGEIKKQKLLITELLDLKKMVYFVQEFCPKTMNVYVKYKRMKFRGIICEKCGVEVTKSNVRRRMGISISLVL